MLNYLWVGLGGALGSVARYWASGFVARHFGETFPLGTLVVNVTGSFLIGFFATLTDTDGRWLVHTENQERATALVRLDLKSGERQTLSVDRVDYREPSQCPVLLRSV